MLVSAPTRAQWSRIDRTGDRNSGAVSSTGAILASAMCGANGFGALKKAEESERERGPVVGPSVAHGSDLRRGPEQWNSVTYDGQSAAKATGKVEGPDVRSKEEDETSTKDDDETRGGVHLTQIIRERHLRTNGTTVFRLSFQQESWWPRLDRSKWVHHVQHG